MASAKLAVLSVIGVLLACVIATPVAAACPTQALLDADTAILSREQTIVGGLGTPVAVDSQAAEAGRYGQRAFDPDVRIHTLGNSSIQRADFCNWTRWYQEVGNTQIFRLFAGETNQRNDRANAARVEAFSGLRWSYDAAQPVYRQFTAHYTLIKPQEGAIFQAKHSGPSAWGVNLDTDADGNVFVAKRRSDKIKVASGMIGKGFDVAVLDNGRDYRVFFRAGNDAAPLTKDHLVAEGSWARDGEGSVSFRWGTYVGGKRPSSDSLVLVSGARFKTLAPGATLPDE